MLLWYFVPLRQGRLNFNPIHIASKLWDLTLYVFYFNDREICPLMKEFTTILCSFEPKTLETPSVKTYLSILMQILLSLRADEVVKITNGLSADFA